MWRSILKRQNEAGFFLLEVLIAIAVLAVGITSSIRVFAQALHTQQKLTELELGKATAENLLFQVASGQMPELFGEEGGSKAGEIEISEEGGGKFKYEIHSTRFELPEPKPSPDQNQNQNPNPSLQPPKKDYHLQIKIMRLDDKFIFKANALLRDEKQGPT